MAIATEGVNRIMIYGPKEDGTYVVEFRTAAGEALAISIPRGETAVLKHFQARSPTGSRCRTPSSTNKNQGGGALVHSRSPIIRAGIGRFKSMS
jgi:hypothetical protein